MEITAITPMLVNALAQVPEGIFVGRTRSAPNLVDLASLEALWRAGGCVHTSGTIDMSAGNSLLGRIINIRA